MAKAKKKSVAKATKAVSKKNPLFREIKTLHSLVIVLYILLAILFIAIYITRFA